MTDDVVADDVGADDPEQKREASATTESEAQVLGKGAAVEDFFSTDDIFRRVLATAAHELERPTGTFIWGSLAAGLIVGFSFLARGGERRGSGVAAIG